jgi:type I restriction enzyme S subunit
LLLKPLIEGDFLLNSVRSPWPQQWIRTASGASAQAHFYISDAKRMPIPLAPSDEQTQVSSLVAERLSQISHADTEISNSLLRAARLRQSILKQAFEGKLVPQDPNEEPALVLLERLKGAGARGDSKEKGKAHHRRAGMKTSPVGNGRRPKRS